MNTSAFGKSMWETMFFVAYGYDLNETPPHIKNPQYINFFSAFQHTIPCRFCRNSFVDFLKQNPIQNYLGEKCGLMKWVYSTKNLVNNKLLKQERIAAIEKYRELQANPYITDDELADKLREISKIFYTKDAPPFEQVVEEYAKHEAKCSAKMKTCRKGALGSGDEEKKQTDMFLNFPQYTPSNATDTMLYAGAARRANPARRNIIKKPTNSRKLTPKRKIVKKSTPKRKIVKKSTLKRRNTIKRR